MLSGVSGHVISAKSERLAHTALSRVNDTMSSSYNGTSTYTFIGVHRYRKCRRATHHFEHTEENVCTKSVKQIDPSTQIVCPCAYEKQFVLVNE